MAQRYFPFNSVGGDRMYKAEDWRAYFAQFIGNGVFYNTSDALKVKEADGMGIIVAAGGGWIDGAGYINTSPLAITLDNADGALNRIDRIVLRADYTERTVTVEVKKGELSAQPAPPALQRDADRYELALADVYVGRGAVSIYQENITDQRLNTALCGVVTGLIQQADTTEIFNQFENYLQNFKAQYIADITAWQQGQEQYIEEWEERHKAQFEAWVATLQEILDESVAGHLQNEIEAETARATKDAFMRFYNMFSTETEFRPDGTIVSENDEATLTVVKGTDANGYKTITETLVTKGADQEIHAKVTTFIPATETTNKIIREEYTRV